MSKDISFWQVYKRQWSWNNDKINLLIYFVTALLLTFIYHFTGSIQTEPTEYYLYGVAILFLILFVGICVVYQSLKAFMMLLFCSLVTYMAKRGDTKAMKMYIEALVWRQ